MGGREGAVAVERDDVGDPGGMSLQDAHGVAGGEVPQAPASAKTSWSRLRARGQVLGSIQTSCGYTAAKASTRAGSRPKPMAMMCSLNSKPPTVHQWRSSSRGILT
jgi:hypothetical protein